MFQYAFYRYLSELKHTELKLDLSSFGSYTLHNGYELKKVFGIESELSTSLDHARLKSRFPLLFRLESKILNKNLLFGQQHILERNFFINEKVFNADFQDFYIEGYFQTERYLQNIEKEIRSTFSFCTDLTSQEQSLLSGTCVSIHIRGGDYLNNAINKRLFGDICSREYYQRAIAHIKQHVQNPHFLVFTNDLDHACDLLNGEVFSIIDYNKGIDSYRDMFLMSHCKHNIIANSSFSWWGAWLNDFSEKIVIAPEKWINTNRINQVDIIPQSWSKVSL
jgi:hypothetical protein